MMQWNGIDNSANEYEVIVEQQMRVVWSTQTITVTLEDALAPDDQSQHFQEQVEEEEHQQQH